MGGKGWMDKGVEEGWKEERRRRMDEKLRGNGRIQEEEEEKKVEWRGVILFLHPHMAS